MKKLMPKMTETETTEQGHELVSRRNLLLSTGRYAAVAAITFTMGKFIVRAVEQECVNNSICDACLAVSGCELPLGLEYKEHPATEPGPPGSTVYEEPQDA